MPLKEDIKKGIACDSVGTPDSILGRAVCLSVHPGKMMLFPFMNWFEKRYKHNYKFARLIFSFDLMLIGALIGVLGVAVFLTLWRPATFADKIYFDATVAPREIIAGAPSTLVIRYTNGTDETLRNTRLSLQFPNHFLLQEVTHLGNPVEADQISLGDIAVGGAGSVRIRGVMFGDVGGEQEFTTMMHFVHGEDRDIAGIKTDSHVFSPIKSTLALELSLPEKLVAFQPVSGTVTYQNTGSIDFPEISIEPAWPDAFEFYSANTSQTDNTFILPAIEAGAEGALEFEGYLGDAGEEVTFIFYPGFVFGDSRYTQEHLEHRAPVVPPQLTIEQSVPKSDLRPGTSTDLTLSYENTGEFDLSDVTIGIQSSNPFFIKDSFSVSSEEYPELERVSAGERGEVTVTIELRDSILQSETNEYENLNLTTQAITSYTLGDGSGQRVSTLGSELTTPLTSPVVLESFGRFATPTGDQLGRGPLPPRVGIETKYWIFWRVSGTTNDLENVRIEGQLPEHVRFTGRQTVSQGDSAIYSSETNSMVWQSELVKSTLSPTSKVAAIAFEIGITPTEEMINTIPTLLENVRFTAVDARTGAIITSSGANITTDLPNDLMASSKAFVE